METLQLLILYPTDQMGDHIPMSSVYLSHEMTSNAGFCIIGHMCRFNDVYVNGIGFGSKLVKFHVLGFSFIFLQNHGYVHDLT